jgi:hypothetical protein
VFLQNGSILDQPKVLIFSLARDFSGLQSQVRSLLGLLFDPSYCPLKKAQKMPLGYACENKRSDAQKTPGGVPMSTKKSFTGIKVKSTTRQNVGFSSG